MANFVALSIWSTTVALKSGRLIQVLLAISIKLGRA